MTVGTVLRSGNILQLRPRHFALDTTQLAHVSGFGA
jgi:hypothetical protein